MWNSRRRSSVRAHRGPVAFVVQPLEERRLLAGIPVSGDWADAHDTYTLTATSPTSTTVTPLTSVKFEVDAATTFPGGGVSVGKAYPTDFEFTLPSGPAAFPFFDAINLGKSMPTVRIDSYTSTGKRRMSWTMSNAFVTSFTEENAPDGSTQDRVSMAYKTIDMSFWRYAADGTTADNLALSWDVPGGIVSGTTTFNGTFLATKPDVLETMELGLGQTPIDNFKMSVVAATNWTSGGGATVGKPVAQGITYDGPDGRNDFPLLKNMLSGSNFTNGIYTRRDATTGLAAQRERFGSVYTTKYAVYDSVFDDKPRTVSIGLVTPRYQLSSYSYSGANNSVQTVASTGFDYTAGAIWNNAINSAHVVGPLDVRVSAPIDTLSFRLITPLQLQKSDFLYDNIDSSLVNLSSPDGGTTWTFSNLAAAQTADGSYAIKLFADRVNALQSSGFTTGLFIGSVGKSWTLDRAAPQVQSAQFGLDGTYATPYSFDFHLSETVAATSADGTVPILVRNAVTGALVTTATGHVDADGISLDASLPPTLADDRYIASLPAGSVRDVAGNLLPTDATLPFFVLAGDANRDGSVNFTDLLTLAKHYGKTGYGFADGNFDYSADGSVTFSDLLILAKRYGTTLPAAAEPELLVASSGEKRRAAVASSIVA